MPIEEALAARLTAALGDARVSSFGPNRGDAYPKTVFNEISPGEEWTHEGPNSIARPRVQMDHYGRTRSEVTARARAAKAEMRVAATVAGVRFEPAQCDGERWIDEGEQDGGQPLFRISQDFLFYFEEI